MLVYNRIGDCTWVFKYFGSDQSSLRNYDSRYEFSLHSDQPDSFHSVLNLYMIHMGKKNVHRITMSN